MIAELDQAVDAWVNQDKPEANHPESNQLQLQGGSTEQKFGYLHFDLPGSLRSGATVVSATLRLTLAKGWGGTNTLKTRRVTEKWGQQRVKWSNKPSTSATNEVSQSVSGSDLDEIEVDVTDLLADVSAGGDYFGFRFELAQNQVRRLYSADAAIAERRPTLTVEWGAQPYPPSQVKPSGGKAVSVAKPVVTWDYLDSRGDTEQAYSQVQISTSTSFTSPAYDSGKVSNVESQWDLSATGFAGLSDSDVRYMRVKVWDGADLESEWSDTVSFTRKTKGTLAIVNPPDSGVVSETTPPLSFTFTGRTLERAEVLVRRINPLTGKIIETEKRWADLDDTSVTLPKDILKSGRTYRLVVRAYDTEDRVGTPGDPRYVEATRQFEYVRDGSPDPVDAFAVRVNETATEGGITTTPPRVVLLWQREEQPDYFSIRVDGEEVVQRVDPEDAIVEGYPGDVYPGDSSDLTGFDEDEFLYRYEYWGARPHHEHSYEVEAVVNDAGKLKHSNGNPVIDATMKTIGIWLVDPEDSTTVFIAGTDGADMLIGVNAETLYGIASRRPVRITDTIRGYEGSVGGTGLNRGSRNRLLKLYGRMTELRLILADLNIPVRLEEVTPTPRSEPGAQLTDMSVSFFQSGEYADAVPLD